MFISLYTMVKNGLFYDFHVVDMLKHHLPFADEIIVNEGYSTDGTYEAIANIDPKIKITRCQWENPGTDCGWYVTLKTAARMQCKGKWCIQLDADEFIPEWEFERIRDYLQHCEDVMVPARFMDFYGNYQVVIPKPMAWRRMCIHRNIPEIEHWGDGANVKLKDQPFTFGDDPLRFTFHHFGCVRHAARLREKWYVQGQMYKKVKKFKLPSFAFNMFPHDWKDPAILEQLEIYPGPHLKAVRDNPGEFVRDDFLLLKFHQEQAAESVASATT
jgi:glycosyltransferase involved in cell wall biosynthesis